MPYSDPETPSRADVLTDAQTGLPNRLHGSVFLEAGWALALRGNGLAVVLMELDRRGEDGSVLQEEAAEHAVQTLGCILADRTRRMDLCARYTGARFLTILPDCPLEQARRYAREVKDSFDDSAFPRGRTKLLVGVSAIKDGMGSPDILLAAAERALYLASEQSRPPPTEPRRARAPVVVVEPPPTQLEALRVLVADDDEATLRATRRILERFGCEVTAVASAREALACITGPEAIDLLVTDIVMPEMSGFTLVDIATRACKDLPVLYMSGYPQEEVYWGGTPGPCSAFMSKPMEIHELRDAVVDLFDLDDGQTPPEKKPQTRGTKSPSAHLEIDGTPDIGVRLEGKILVVDDDQVIVGSLQRLFRRVGYAKPAGITDTRLVLDFVKREHVDLIIPDLYMPEVDGFQLLASLSSIFSAEEYLPILVITGDDSPEVRQRALAAGAMGFLTKPFDPAEAEARVPTCWRPALLRSASPAIGTFWKRWSGSVPPSWPIPGRRYSTGSRVQRSTGTT